MKIGEVSCRIERSGNPDNDPKSVFVKRFQLAVFESNSVESGKS